MKTLNQELETVSKSKQQDSEHHRKLEKACK